MGIDLRGMPQLRKRLHAIQNGKVILHKLQLDTVYEAKKRVPRKTGNTGRTIRPGFLTNSEAFVKAGGAAAYLEHGTGLYGPRHRKYPIVPKNGKALRFPASGVSKTLGGRARTGEVKRLGSGAYVFSQGVMHPGIKPQPFLLPGAKAAASRQGLADSVVSLWNKAA